MPPRATFSPAWESDATTYATRLLEPWSALDVRVDAGRDLHPAIAWAQSGAMAVTGLPEQPALAPGSLAACARGALAALRALAEPAALGREHDLELDAPALLGERAAIFDLKRRGRTAPGGSCHLLRARGGWIALNLARTDDREAIPAWLGEPVAGDDAMAFVAQRVAEREVEDLVFRGRLLGLPIAPVCAADPSTPWIAAKSIGRARAPARDDTPLVVDLSSLWAGPLCTHLLSLCGARVLKVESETRPDGARAGSAAFFDLMNGGKRSVALDFDSASGRATLRALLGAADIVVESARPRALEQLGLLASELLDERPGKTWISITGYGRSAPERDWIAFGDDAAAAAGLPLRTGLPEHAPLFCGDAIADPLTGLHAAVAALACWRSGGGRLLDVALRNVTAHAASFRGDAGGARVVRRGAGWAVAAGGGVAPVAPPRARVATAAARPLGADGAVVRRELGISC